MLRTLRLAAPFAAVLTLLACDTTSTLPNDDGGVTDGGGDAGLSVASGTYSGDYCFTSPCTCQPFSVTVADATVLIQSYASVGAGYSTVLIQGAPASAGGGAAGEGLTTVTSPASQVGVFNFTFCIDGTPAAGTFTQASANNAALITTGLGALPAADGWEAGWTPDGGACAQQGSLPSSSPNPLGTYTLTLTSVEPYNAGEYIAHGSLVASMVDVSPTLSCTATLNLTF